MSLLTLQNLGFDYGHVTVLDGLNLTVNAGERYGLIGVNGAGKSTLMRLIVRQMEPTRGRIERGGRLRVGFLEQDTTLTTQAPLRQAVRQEAFGELLRIEADLAALSERLGQGEEAPELLEEYGRLHELFEQYDGYTMESRTDAALQGLGFANDRLDQPVATLSGGQKRRAALAALLLAPFDLILVDEPTNHLDLEAREWLEAHLRDRRGAMIAISHDRAFLDNATDYTLHLINGKLNRFQGAYTKFAKMWAEQKVQWEDQYNRQKDHIAKTEAFIRKNIAGQRTNQAKSRRKQLARLERMEAPPNEGQKLRLRIEPARESGAVVLEVQGLTQRFDTLTLFEKLDFQILRGEKVGVLGPNGTGKTTLLRLLTREHTPAAGRIAFGSNVDLGYYDQDLRLVNDSNTVLREIHQMDPLTSEGDVRGMLGAFAFSGDMVDQEVRTLSGGERARLSLLKLILERHNFPLLDEPTNHLDTDTREALEEALVGYSGTLVVVSHDRYFLNRICNRIFAFQSKAGGGTAGVRQFLGNYDDYKFRLQSEREARNANAAAKPAPAVAAAPKLPPRAVAPVKSTPATSRVAAPPKPAPERDRAAVADKRLLSKNELRKVRQEVLDLEEEIELLESDIELAGDEMSSGALSGEDMARAAARVQKQQAALEAKLARWETLNALMERGESR